ncbi:MAG: ATP synthase F1 subunit delta [Pirellulaceae bacterium]
MTDEQPQETVLDVDQQQVGALYAKALLGSAGNSVDTIVSELEAVVNECLSQHPRLEQALASPRISQEQKEGMLDRIFSGRVDSKLLNFLKILCRRGRIDSLRAIQVTATTMREEAMGKTRMHVKSAHPLNDQQRKQIADKLSQVYNTQAILIEEVDESLLGGIVIRIGDRVLDGSILGKMNSIRTGVASGVQKAIRDRFETLLSP